MEKRMLYLLVIFFFLLTFVSAQCNDSDVNSAFPDGKNYYVKGTTEGTNRVGTDFCGIRTVPEFSEPTIVNNCEKMEWASGQKCTLYEFACNEEGHAVRWEYECPYGCEDGACILECTDTDGGKNHYMKGTVKGLTTVGQVVEDTDKCFVLGDQVPDEDIGKLGEYYCCFGSGICLETYECPNGCRDGACIETIECDFDGDCQVAYGEGYTCENGVCIIQEAGKCGDGTSFGECSINKPVYCYNNGMLGDNCELCGCDIGYTCGLEGISCIEGSIGEICDNSIDDDNDGFIDCIDNECVRFSPCITCSDTDGDNQYIRGHVEGHWGCPQDNEPIEEYDDYCVNKNTVFEFICNAGCDNLLAHEVYCPFGCKDGACVQEKACINSGDCPTKHVCQNGVCVQESALYLIEEDIGQYRFDSLIIAININSIQYTAFYNKEEKNYWATVRVFENEEVVKEDLEILFASQPQIGTNTVEVIYKEQRLYYIHEPTGGTFSYLWTHNNYIIDIGGQLRELEEPTELLDAYLEKFPSDIEGIPIVPDNEIGPYTSCQGCGLGNKCYPFGYRKKGEYCSDNYEFVEQLERDSICDNNFECRSNICVSDECISGNLIQRILNWFRRLFGIE